MRALREITWVVRSAWKVGLSAQRERVADGFGIDGLRPVEKGRQLTVRVSIPVIGIVLEVQHDRARDEAQHGSGRRGNLALRCRFTRVDAIEPGDEGPSA